MNKTAIVIAAVFSTMILLSVGGIVYAAQASRTAEPASTLAPEVVSGEALPADREAAYQAQIEEANQRLLEAQATQRALEAEINALQGPVPDPGRSEWIASGDGGDYDDDDEYGGEHDEHEDHDEDEHEDD